MHDLSLVIWVTLCASVEARPFLINCESHFSSALKDSDGDILQQAWLVFWTLCTILGLLDHSILKTRSSLVDPYENTTVTAQVMSYFMWAD
jgi:hypothetical protein